MVNFSDNNDIEVVASLDPDLEICIEQIKDVLSQKEQSLKHGEKYTGRPSTRIFANDRFVVKLKFSFNFKVVEARRWVNDTIELERVFDIYHPAKTWFLILTDEGAIIANITPMLNPLHEVCENGDRKLVLDLILRVVNCYFRVALNHDKRLDEGLSNFGIDEDCNFYYLDDDIYEWDGFTSICASISILLLKLDQLEERDWATLGDLIRAHIVVGFVNSHWSSVFIEQLKVGFIANDRQLTCRNALISSLNRRRGSKKGAATVNRSNEATAPSLESAYKSGEITEDTIAIIADIHSNLPALEAVMCELDQLGVKQGVVLGDVVGYGPHPRECIELVKARGFSVIKGNHDNAVATGNTSLGFSNYAKWVVEWSQELLSEDDLYWLESLPSQIINDDWLALHGAPVDKTFFNAYVYRMTYEENLSNINGRDIKICFHGHTHMPTVYYRNKSGDHQDKEKSLSLEKHIASLVCPGSVGKTRSQIPVAEFALFNRKSYELQFYNVDYDLDKTVSDMKSAGFPQQLIERLMTGQ